MKADGDYAELALKAEKAVSALKDPELRKVAFEKILDELLGRSAEESSSGNDQKATKKTSPAPPPKVKAAVHAPVVHGPTSSR